MAGAPPASSPPDWDHFALDLFCPRCGYNLRMLTGNRCPECGLDLDWNRIIAATQGLLDSPFFEHQWHTQPVRSLLRTIVLAFFPRRMWRSIVLEAIPRTRALAA